MIIKYHINKIYDKDLLEHRVRRMMEQHLYFRYNPNVNPNNLAMRWLFKIPGMKQFYKIMMQAEQIFSKAKGENRCRYHTQFNQVTPQRQHQYKETLKV